MAAGKVAANAKVKVFNPIIAATTIWNNAAEASRIQAMRGGLHGARQQRSSP